MRRKIAILVLLIIGIIAAVIGWQMDSTNGTNTTTMILLIGGTLLTVGMLGVICRDIRDSISDWINRK